MRGFSYVSLGLALMASLIPPAIYAEDLQLLWGDTHLHTSYSFDAFLNGNLTADPDVAYRYARGQPVIHPYNRTRVQINTPLDFLVVSDHAEFMGGIRDIYYEGIQDPDLGILDKLMYWYGEWKIRSAIDSGTGPDFFNGLLPVLGDPKLEAEHWRDRQGLTIPGADISGRRAWKSIGEIADRYNTPGQFTALIGWEWSSTPAGANLHRIVVTSANAEQARQFSPFGSTDSPYPEDLWAWMEKTSGSLDIEMLAIPHNSNISRGQMFRDQSLRGETISAEYARQRLAWEPVVEVTQIKGDSETHPILSPDDEFADFESYPFYILQKPAPYEPQPGDFIRSALKIGLALEQRTGVNPYQFGLIGSTDSHTGLSSAEEPNFWGKMARDSIPENKAATVIAGGSTGWTMSAAGLAAVWAHDNTRPSIIAALKRKEVYATTGTRIRVRVFGGWNFSTEDLLSPDQVERGYASGVPMGGVMPEHHDDSVSPSFLIDAMKDPLSGNLDRIQMIKGWVDATGETHEKVFDVVWSDHRVPDDKGRLPAVRNTVDRLTGVNRNESGSSSLQSVWADPEFDSNQRAFYYVRVLEVPTVRHSLLDALALGLQASVEGPDFIQERAYTSPIWYQP